MTAALFRTRARLARLAVESVVAFARSVLTRAVTVATVRAKTLHALDAAPRSRAKASTLVALTVAVTGIVLVVAAAGAMCAARSKVPLVATTGFARTVLIFEARTVTLAFGGTGGRLASLAGESEIARTHAVRLVAFPATVAVVRAELPLTHESRAVLEALRAFACTLFARSASEAVARARTKASVAVGTHPSVVARADAVVAATVTGALVRTRALVTSGT